MSILVLVFATGCTTYYKPATQDSSSLATIRGTTVDRGFGNYEEYFISMIDDLLADYGFDWLRGDLTTFDITERDLPVDPGTHRIAVNFLIKGGTWKIPYHARYSLNFEAEKGAAYVLTGQYEFDKNKSVQKVTSWIERKDSGERVSEIIEARAYLGSGEDELGYIIPPPIF